MTTTNLLPGYIRKNGVPYSEKAVLTEYINRLTGEQNDVYLSVTAMVEDPTYLTQPFVRTYTFKKLPDATGWEPTPCWNRYDSSAVDLAIDCLYQPISYPFAFPPQPQRLLHRPI